MTEGFAMGEGQGSSAVRTEDAPYSLDYAALPVAHTPPWGMLTVWDVWLNNVSLGLFLVAAACAAFGPASLIPVVAWAFCAAWAGLLLDLLLLVMDLGDPARFHHMLRTVRPLSPMWVGVWALSLSSLFMALPALWGLAFLLEQGGMLPEGLALWTRLPGAAGRIAPAVLGMGVLCASAGLLYKGVLFSATSRPVWKEARWFPAYLTSGALLLGGAAFMGIAAVCAAGQSLPHADVLLPAMLALLAVDTAFLEGYLRPLLRKSARSRCLHGAAALNALAAACLLWGSGAPAALCAVAAIALSGGLARFAFVMPDAVTFPLPPHRLR